MAGTVKLKDIAAAANCSANTVSRALRDCADIGDETKEKIKRIAAELNYVPDNIAGSLRYGKTNLIALVASSLTDPFVAAASDMLVRRLRDKGFIPILMIARGDRRGALLADIKANRVCAVISFFDPDDDIKEYCRGGGHPSSRNGQYFRQRRQFGGRGRPRVRRACRKGVCRI